MADPLMPLRQRFLERASTSNAWGFLAFQAPRSVVAVLLGLVVPLALLAAAFLGGLPMLEAGARPDRVSDVFSRFATGIVAGGSIAASVAVLTLQRELRSVTKLREHVAANHEFRDRLRQAAEGGRTPLALGPLLALALDALAESARRVRDAAGPKGLAETESGVTLGDYLDTLVSATERSRQALLRSPHQPERMYHALLDLEDELTDQLARRFGRNEALSPGTRAAITTLRERLEDVVVGKNYAKTLDLQWTLSRMVVAIVLTALPALATAFSFALLYSDALVADLGARGALVVVAAGLFLLTMPLVAFTSYLLRVVFINQYTLPSAGFVFGPEEPEVVGQPPPAKRRPTAGEGRSLPPPM